MIGLAAFIPDYEIPETICWPQLAAGLEFLFRSGLVAALAGRPAGFDHVRYGLGGPAAARTLLLEALQAQDRCVEILQLLTELGENFTQIHGS
jgi:hypothetical protein